jgi:hypothetical protein
MKFCDYLNVWQEFPDWKGGEFVGGRVISIEGACGFGRAMVVHEDSGEVAQAWAVSGSDDVEYATAKFVQQTGSYETSIFIRMVGAKLEVRGNPSAWGRFDNLFGVGLDDGLSIYNEILRGLDLPEFCSGEVISMFDQKAGKLVKRYTGCHITRADITENNAVGMGRVRDYHKWIAQQKLYRSSPDDKALEQFSKWNYDTVYSSDSKFWLNVKHYDKAAALEDRTLPEYFKKLRESARTGKISKSEVRPLYQEAEDYLGKLAEWCAEVGITRSEWSFRNRWFLQHDGAGFWKPGETETLLLEAAEREQEKITMRAVVYQVESFDGLSGAAYKALDQWKKGEDVKSTMPRTTFYRLRAQVLERTGYDIASRPLLSSAIEFRPVYFQVRSLSLADAPVWYVRPSYPQQLAA